MKTGKMEETAAGAEKPEHATRLPQIVESDSLSRGSQNQNDSAGQNTELYPSKFDLYKKGKMESSSDACPEIDAHEIQLADINSGASSSQGPQNQNQAPATYNFPDRGLLDDEERYGQIRVAFRTAALEGDWKRAVHIFGISGYDPRSMLRMAITKERETALHIAIGARRIAFAKEILQFIQPEDLLLQDHSGNTAFSVAAATGNIEIAMAMKQKNPTLVTVKNGMNKTPLYTAVMFGQNEMAVFLYNTTATSLSPDDRTALFFISIKTDLYGIALYLLQYFPDLASERDVNSETALHLLARKPSSTFETMSSLNGESNPTTALQLLQLILSMQDLDLKKIVISYPSNVLFNAARLGNFGFLAELIRAYPSLVHELDSNHQTIFHIAISLRQMSVFNLIRELGFHKEVIATYVDVHDNNILHLAAKYPNPPPPSSMSTAALEMQQELKIFEEVEKLVPHSLREAKNAEGLTPSELFTRDHRKLVQSGAKWMKSTASSCMVVATLIATVVSSSPGGSNDKTERLSFTGRTFLHVFALSDAIALSSSSFSILMFLSIITSGFSQNEFHTILPRKLMIGMVALFMSIVSMMVTFTSNYYLVYRERSFFIPFLSFLFASVPISQFVLLQYSLLGDIFLLTYRDSALLRIIGKYIELFRFGRFWFSKLAK